MIAAPNRLTDPPNFPALSESSDLFADVLATIRLAGAIFLRAEYTSPWAYESPPPEILTSILQPDAKRLILFHIVAEGGCWIGLEHGENLEAQQGDVVVLPYGAQHVMGSAQHVPSVPIGSLLPAPPWNEFPVIRYGGGGPRASVVCGYLTCDDPIFDPVVGALPPLFSVRPPVGPAADWVDASIQYALNVSRGHSPSGSMALRLPELLFLEVLRLYVESAPPNLSRWLAALHDPIVGRALVALHAEPARKWTADDLAWQTACSRSSLNARFARLLGRAPMQYLSDLRIRIAAGLLRDTTFAVSEVAFQVGYESEEAFSRAFKRAMRKPPARWRRHVATAGHHARDLVRGGQ